MQVSLGNIRSIKVIIVGEVVKPGTYTLPSLATAFNALSSAGGPNDVGSYRKIEIIRNNRVEIFTSKNRIPFIKSNNIHQEK